jgi:hypothetical protein
MNKFTDPGYMASLGMVLGSGLGSLIAVLIGTAFGYEDPLVLMGLGLFGGFTLGGFAGDWAYKAMRAFQDETVERAALEIHTKRRQPQEASLPEWWPTNEELEAALNEPPSGNETPEVTIIVPSPRPRKRPDTD